jgi:hypothetical protein
MPLRPDLPEHRQRNLSETCSTRPDYGKNRYNPDTGHMQVCVPR